MNKFFRKNQKKLLAIATVFLMVVFVINLSPQNQHGGTVARTIGTLGGTKVIATDLAEYSNELKLLSSLQYVDPNNPDSDSAPLIVRLVGPGVAGELQKALNQNQPLFYLLVQEANREGIVATSEQFNTFINSYVRPLPDEGTSARDNVDLAVLHGFQVKMMLDRLGGVVKISKPMQRFWLAREAQLLTLKFVGIQGSHYLADIPTPTQDQIAAQYDKFKDHLPAVPGALPSQYGAPDDPLGFGYKVPDRVTLQYVSISNSDLRDAAIASKSQQDWYIAAFGEFAKNRDTYDSQPIDSSATSQPSTQPITRRVENIQDDFALHAQPVLTTLYDRQADDLRDQVIKDLTDKLSSGYGAFRDQQNAAGSAAPATRPGQYASFGYLATLADSLQQQFGVRASVADFQQLKTAAQLRDVETIGKAVLEIPGSQPPLSFPEYAVQLFQPLMPDVLKTSRYAPLALSPWQASNPMTDEKRDVFIFRITGYDPAHTAPPADVRDKAIADYRLSIAYGKAMDAAQQLASVAGKSGLSAAAIAGNYPSPRDTDPFVPNQILTGQQPPVISPLRMSPASAIDLSNQSQDLLSGATAGNQKPQAVAPLPADAMVSVIELTSAVPTWQSSDEALYRARLIEQTGQQTQEGLLAKLCSFDEVSHRLEYVPESTGK